MTRSSRSKRARWLSLSVCVALLGAASLVAGARPAQAGENVWTSNGPEGRQILAIDPITPSRLYAATEYAGVFAIDQAQVVGTGTPASCTEAALDAALAPGGLVTFDCGAEPVTITITTTQTIAKDATIDGGGRVTVSGANAVRVFAVNADVAFDVRNLTIADGHGSSGGGIANSGTLTATNSIFSANSGDIGGGGIANSGTLTVTGCTFSGNRAGLFGGAIGNEVQCQFIGGCVAIVTKTTFSANTARVGGGIANVEGIVIVSNSTFSANTADGFFSGIPSGGGIANIDNYSELTVSNSTFIGNSAANGGGGIANVSFCDSGSCLGAQGGPVVVINSTFSANSASAGAGGIDSDFRSLPATVTNSLIANSSGANCGFRITDGGHNLQFPGTSCGATIPSLDPLLDPAGLKDNGGPTRTIALLPGSPAVNAGDPEVCANPPVSGVDQRGYVRPGVGRTQCSIGAYEADAVAAAACVGDCDGAGGVTIDEIITLVNIALETADLAACPHGVGSGVTLDVALIIQAVNAALLGCAGA